MQLISLPFSIFRLITIFAIFLENSNAKRYYKPKIDSNCPILHKPSARCLPEIDYQHYSVQKHWFYKSAYVYNPSFEICELKYLPTDYSVARQASYGYKTRDLCEKKCKCMRWPKESYMIKKKSQFCYSNTRPATRQCVPMGDDLSANKWRWIYESKRKRCSQKLVKSEAIGFDNQQDCFQTCRCMITSSDSKLPSSTSLESLETIEEDKIVPFRASYDEVFDEVDFPIDSTNNNNLINYRSNQYVCHKKKRAPGNRKTICSPDKVSDVQQNSYVIKKFVYDGDSFECRLRYVNDEAVGYETMSKCEDECRCI